MSQWNDWDRQFNGITLANDGDNQERRAVGCSLIAAFPNYEVLWRNHVAPATERPRSIALRANSARSVQIVAIISYSILYDLLDSIDEIDKAKKAAGPEENIHFCRKAIKDSGDAMQKFMDLKDAIANELAQTLGVGVDPIPDALWRSKYKRRREDLVAHRNFLTHVGHPLIIYLPDESGNPIPHVLKGQYIDSRNRQTWDEQRAIFDSSPEKWEPIFNSASLLLSETTTWLNEAYGDLISAMQPLLGTPGYMSAWGWDLTKAGSEAWMLPVPPPGGSTTSGGLSAIQSSGLATTNRVMGSGSYTP